jgi:hypothetical protein
MTSINAETKTAAKALFTLLNLNLLWWIPYDGTYVSWPLPVDHLLGQQVLTSRSTSENSSSQRFRQQPRLIHGLVPKLLSLAAYPGSALAPTAADGLVDLFTVVTYRAKEHPALKAVEAVALLSYLVLLVGRGVLGALR